MTPSPMKTSSTHGSHDSLATSGPSAASRSSVQDTAKIMDKAWEDVQKKTFTKWVNTKLQMRGLAINDITTDLTDGVNLIQLLEIIGDESLGKFNRVPKMRIQKIENQNTALAFIKRRGVNLTNIGAEDLTDGNEKLALGLIWTIILRFTIADISEEGLTAKEGLLLWCQRKTAPYNPEVQVKDFSFSWQDGLAFCALIHRHRPDLLDFHALNKADKHGNMALAFDVAAKHLGIPKLLDVEDVVDLPKPDERSVMTYVAQYFHAFSQLDKFEVAGRRVAKFAELMSSVFQMQNDYERRARALVDGMAAQQAAWHAEPPAAAYVDAKQQSTAFNEYKSTIKRGWVAEKRDLDALLGNIQTKLITYHLKPYAPPKGLAPADVDAAWQAHLTHEASRKKAINAQIKEIKEQLMVAFAKTANDLQAHLNTMSAALAGLNGELDDQRAKVEAAQADLPKHQAALQDLKRIGRECEAANVEENEYTIYAVEDVEFDLGLVATALTKKLQFIENQSVARQLTNLTPQQLEEFETTFRHFDKDLSNTLNAIEFKASLAGLGIAYTDAEFDQVFTQVSGGTAEINFEQFVQYMRSVTEDKTSSPDQVLAAFQALANAKGHVTEADMRVAHITPEVMTYLREAMPHANGDKDALDYRAFLAQCFEGTGAQ
ncbi:hypothetical protein AMAG_10174 [Allomyces macrogynus ATCC 38327]|uniref:Uncharacterized protein n=1 Tax=Allomyces macrogynus (strain ATCC 38327) TaxID=578462 RepID=A0A0L0SR25_ALLM3|nr:hypothetical protein AMAG_10174 [Allomyces macrogynus ATCC 38327]|eukprot:KNE64839.1 hypothetical protein AMAG_10174 [Allomyces macrogynus ATCC 38327]